MSAEIIGYHQPEQHPQKARNFGGNILGLTEEELLNKKPSAETNPSGFVIGGTPEESPKSQTEAFTGVIGVEPESPPKPKTVNPVGGLIQPDKPSGHSDQLDLKENKR